MNYYSALIFNKLRIIALLTITVITNSCFHYNQAMIQKEAEKELSIANSAARKYCISLGLDFGEQDHIKNEMYFRCKIELLEKSKIETPISSRQISFNQALKRLLAKERVNYESAAEKVAQDRNAAINKKHHKICSKRGFKITNTNQEKVESYYKCRKSLILVYHTTPAYNKNENLNYTQSSYNTQYVVNKKQDFEIKNSINFTKNYPNCKRYNYKSNKAQKCKDDHDKMRSCVATFRVKAIERKNNMYKSCQEKLYAKLPDTMLITEKENNANKKNYITDLYLNPSLHAFLSDKEAFSSFEAKELAEEGTKDEEDEIVKEVEKDEIKEDKIYNSFDNLYTRSELVSLRKNFIKSCTSEIEPKIKKYVDYNNKNCKSIISQWLKKPKKPKKINAKIIRNQRS